MHRADLRVQGFGEKSSRYFVDVDLFWERFRNED